MTPLFTVNDAWTGGYYELVFGLPSASKRAATSALVALWDHPSLACSYLRRDVEPSQQQKHSLLEVEEGQSAFGIATLPNGTQSCCGCFWANYQDAGSWVTLYLPLGSLGQAYSVGTYPFHAEGELSPESWLKVINGWLKDIAVSVYSQVRFELAIIGYEVDMFALKARHLSGALANEWDGVLVPNGNEVVWHPPTHYDPPHTLKKRLS